MSVIEAKAQRGQASALQDTQRETSKSEQTARGQTYRSAGICGMSTELKVQTLTEYLKSVWIKEPELSKDVKMEMKGNCTSHRIKTEPGRHTLTKFQNNLEKEN